MSIQTTHIPNSIYWAKFEDGNKTWYRRCDFLITRDREMVFACLFESSIRIASDLEGFVEVDLDPRNKHTDAISYLA